MTNLEAFKVGGVQKKEKKREAFCELESLLFFFLFFSLLLFICTSKMISIASGGAPVTF
jgi:hypothetical protein